jgi:hypothetical protein
VRALPQDRPQPPGRLTPRRERLGGAERGVLGRHRPVHLCPANVRLTTL